MTAFVCQFSGGLASAEAAQRIAAQHGRESVRLLFCDTLCEDEDLYRFLIESAAHVFGVLTPDVRKLAATARELPTVESNRWPERKAALAALRAAAMALVPGFAWIADGRHIWEVFRDERFIGNSRTDPCSKILKRQLAARWMREHYDPGNAVLVFGMTYAEQTRIEKVTANQAEAGWRCVFPMDDPPYLSRVPLMQASIDRGIVPPRLYYQGFKHNNCAGWCCKSGQAPMRKLLEYHPRRFAYHEREEQAMRDYLGKDVSILTDTRDGKKRPLTLTLFRQRYETTGVCDESDWGACSCFSEDEETVGAA